MCMKWWFGSFTLSHQTVWVIVPLLYQGGWGGDGRGLGGFPLSVRASVLFCLQMGFWRLQKKVLGQWFCHLVQVLVYQTLVPYWFWSSLGNFRPSDGQNHVCRRNSHTFCISVSNWWEVITCNGVFCPHLWLQHVEFKVGREWHEIQ